MGEKQSIVFYAIKGEREYQEQRQPEHHRHSLTEYLVYINHYVNRAFTVVSTEDSPDDFARAQLRKIAALAVAALEEHGVQFRKGYIPTTPLEESKAIKTEQAHHDDEPLI